MEKIDQGDEGIVDAQQPEIGIGQVLACVPGEDKKRKGNGDGSNLHEPVEEEILTVSY
jgi:hypothetical protein